MHRCRPGFERVDGYTKLSHPVAKVMDMPRPRRFCEIDGCEDRQVGRGWCRKHYTRWHRYGSPEFVTPPKRRGTCRMDGCDNPHKAQGLCQTHYRRLQRRGDPLVAHPTGKWPRASVEHRFWAKVQKTDGCWLWTGYTDASGYGMFMYEGKQRRVHRIVMQWETGEPLPSELEVDHLCGVRKCVRPSHLELVTHAENVRRRPYTTPTHCKYGHPFEGANLYVTPAGRRMCRECGRKRSRDHDRRRQEARVQVA